MTFAEPHPELPVAGALCLPSVTQAGGLVSSPGSATHLCGPRESWCHVKLPALWSFSSVTPQTYIILINLIGVSPHEGIDNDWFTEFSSGC